MPKKPKSSSPHDPTCKVPIQFGQFKGKILRYHKVPQSLRPTLARARDVLFNWLPHWQGMSCWDLFAGTGILGIQSLCLGAREVTFVEPDASLRTQMAAHLRLLGFSGQSACLAESVPQCLPLLPQGVQRVFCDPPFAQLDLYYDLVARDDFAQSLAPGAIIYVELPRGATLSPFQKTLKQKHLGDVSIYLVHDCRNLP